MTSLAVWDVPMPAVAGGRFAVKVGATAPALKIEVSDASGKVVAAGALGREPLPGTEALCWTTLDIPAPAMPGVAEYTVRADGASSRFAVAVAAKPERVLTVSITERDTNEALAGVDVRLGPFQSRTDATGRASLQVCDGDYQLKLWRTAYIAQPQPIRIDSNVNLKLTMVHVPEEHPDARWVR